MPTLLESTADFAPAESSDRTVMLPYVILAFSPMLISVLYQLSVS